MDTQIDDFSFWGEICDLLRIIVFPLEIIAFRLLKGSKKEEKTKKNNAKMMLEKIMQK